MLDYNRAMPFRANIAAVAGAGGIFMQATLADGKVMTYSVELQEG